VTVLPIAPFLAFVNNIVSLRIDAKKYTNTYRRITPHYDTGISIWFRIFEVLSFCGVLSTGFVMAFSSQVIPHYVREYYGDGEFDSYVDDHFALYKPLNCSFPSTLDDDGNHTKLSLTILCVRLIFLIFFENAVYVAKIALYASIPQVPRNIQLREELANCISQAVIAEVTGVESDASSSEDSDCEGADEPVECSKQFEARKEDIVQDVEQRRRSTTITLASAFGEENTQLAVFELPPAPAHRTPRPRVTSGALGNPAVRGSVDKQTSDNVAVVREHDI